MNEYEDWEWVRGVLVRRKSARSTTNDSDDCECEACAKVREITKR
jgi:hypothetical protein